MFVAFGRVEFHLSGGWLHHEEAWLHPWEAGDATIIGTLQPLADLWPTWKVTRKHLQIFQILIVLHSQDFPISKSPESMLVIYLKHPNKMAPLYMQTGHAVKYSFSSEIGSEKEKYGNPNGSSWCFPPSLKLLVATNANSDKYRGRRYEFVYSFGYQSSLLPSKQF